MEHQEDCSYIPITFDPKLIYGFFQSTICTKYVEPVIQNLAVCAMHIDYTESWHETFRKKMLEVIALDKEKPDFYELDISIRMQIMWRLLSGDGESLDSVDTSSAAYQTQYQAVYDALSKSDSAYQTLATKVNNAIKLSIEQYVTAYNKAHKKADADKGIRKGRISVSSTKSFQRDYPYGAFAAAVLGFCKSEAKRS